MGQSRPPQPHRKDGRLLEEPGLKKGARDMSYMSRSAPTEPGGPGRGPGAGHHYHKGGTGAGAIARAPAPQDLK